VKAEKFIADWLDKAIVPVFRDTYVGERRRWKDGRPAGADGDEPAVSVEAIEFQLCDEQDSSDAARAMFSGLDADQRDRMVYDALRRLVEVGKAIRVQSTDEEIADQLFKPVGLLEAIAHAAQ
jgi:hypothetical protein